MRSAGHEVCRRIVERDLRKARAESAPFGTTKIASPMTGRSDRQPDGRWNRLIPGEQARRQRD
jgi:hypothetical protein